MTSEKKNEIGADDSNGRVRKIRKAAALALKESDQLRLADRCVLHIRGRWQNYGTRFNLFCERKSLPIPRAI